MKVHLQLRISILPPPQANLIVRSRVQIVEDHFVGAELRDGTEVCDRRVARSMKIDVNDVRIA